MGALALNVVIRDVIERRFRGDGRRPAALTAARRGPRVVASFAAAHSSSSCGVAVHVSKQWRLMTASHGPQSHSAAA